MHFVLCGVFFFLLIFFLFCSLSTVLQHPFCTIGLFCRQDGELYAFLPLVPADKNLKHNPPYPPPKYMQPSRCQSTGCVALNVLRSSVWSVLIVIKCSERCFLIEFCLFFLSSYYVGRLFINALFEHAILNTQHLMPIILGTFPCLDSECHGDI